MNVKPITVGIALLFVSVALAGCTGTRFGGSNTGEAESESKGPVSANLFARSDNADGDAADETVLNLQVRTSDGSSTECDCSVEILASNRLDRRDEVPQSWETVMQHSIQKSDFGALGVGFVVDDGKFCGWRTFKAIVRLGSGDSLEAVTKELVSCEGESLFSGGGTGYADYGDRVTSVSILASSENTDNDQPLELTGSLGGEGKDDDGRERFYRFNGSLKYRLLWDSGAKCLEDPYNEIASGSIEFGPDDFSGSILPALKWTVDDDAVANQESYRLEVTVTINSTDETLSDVDDIYFSDDADQQEAPAPPDEGAEVTTLDLLASSSNEDADAMNEVTLKVRGEGLGDRAYCRFSGTIDVALHLKQGYGSSATYSKVSDWTFDAVPEDFEGLFPSYEVILQDEHFEDGETYRFSASVRMDRTGEVYEGTDSFWYRAQD